MCLPQIWQRQASFFTSHDEGVGRESKEWGPSQGSRVVGESADACSQEGPRPPPSTQLRLESSQWQGEQAGGAGPPTTPLLRRRREPPPRGVDWHLRNPRVGQSGSQKRWMRMWTKSVAGDSEAPSLESRWMWRYPVGRGTCLRFSVPDPTGPGPWAHGPHPTPGLGGQALRGDAKPR